MPLKFWKSKKDKLPQSAPPLARTIGYTKVPLRDQSVVQAPTATKIKLTILATALVDALGGPVEFQPRFSFLFTTSYKVNSNFRDAHGKPLAPGVWTDDTSMTLCLARSIARYGFNEARQLDAYLNWHVNGELSAIGYCFDIGGTTGRALRMHQSAVAANPSNAPDDASKSLQLIHEQLSSDKNAGNGSLMRVIPVGLAFWRDPDKAREYARRSSQTTHPTPICLEICEVWTAAVTQIMEHACTAKGLYSKFELLRYISEYPFQSEKLKAALSLPADANRQNNSTTSSDPDGASLEELYWKTHPILRLIAEIRDNPSATETGYLKLPAAKVLNSGGYSAHSLVAALYCFFATDNFETGAIMAINLGDDSDTTGAIYAGLAGCWYADTLPPAPKSSKDGRASLSDVAAGLFWSQQVCDWNTSLFNREPVEEVAEELAEFEKGWKSSK